MVEDSDRLRERINRLSDEELTAMATTDRKQYRDEAIVFAEAELQRRGLSIALVEYLQTTGERSFFARGPEAEADGPPFGLVASQVHSEQAQAQQVQALHHAAFKVFRGTFVSWDELFIQAAEFINQIGPERVISISHSADSGDGVVAVWYWT